jgi:NADH-quinone oxidoreductase subunit N
MDALIVVFVTGLVSMFIAMAKKPVLVLLTAVLGLTLSMGLLITQWWSPRLLFKYEGLFFDRSTILFGVLALFFALLIITGGYRYFKTEVEHTGEYVSLLLFSLVGVLCMLSFTDLFMFFLGLEIMSIPIYVMAGSRKKDIKSTEASLKYFFTGAFATGIFLFGTAWVYGATGSFKLTDIQTAIYTGAAQGPLLYIGVLMIMASFLFKVGAAPFHFWSPDVYGGSPVIVTGFMASIVKLAGLYACLKLITFVFGDLSYLWSGALFGLIVLTMFVGNLSAINQTKFKRLLAYSSIANAGYALLAVMTQDIQSVWNLWVYLIGYGFSIIALVIIALVLNDEHDEISSYKGIGRKYPFVGFVMTLSILSLAGVPPLAGFFGKYMVFSNAFTHYPLLVILAVINSGIGIYYYLRLLITALSKEENTVSLNPSFLQYLVLGICSIGLLIGGFVAF